MLAVSFWLGGLNFITICDYLDSFCLCVSATQKHNNKSVCLWLYSFKFTQIWKEPQIDLVDWIWLKSDVVMIGLSLYEKMLEKFMIFMTLEFIFNFTILGNNFILSWWIEFHCKMILFGWYFVVTKIADKRWS